MSFLVALAFGLFVFVVACEKYAPPPKLPREVTIDDVWASIQRAQGCVDESYALIYGERLTSGETQSIISSKEEV